jgi:signal transduction histidine kinase/uncharacterized protein YigA (DUF484 family)
MPERVTKRDEPEHDGVGDDIGALRQRVDELTCQLTRSEDRLAWIHEIGAMLSEYSRHDELLQAIMVRITRIMNAERATLFLWDEASDGLHLYSRVLVGSETREIRLRVGEGIAGWVAAHGRSVNVKDAYLDARFDRRFDEGEAGFRTSSVLCQPMRAKDGRVVGVVEVLNKRTGYFTPDDEALLGAVSNTAVIVLENYRLLQTLHERNRELIQAQRALTQQLDRLDLLFEIQTRAGQANTLDEVVEAVAAGAARVINSEAVAVSVADGSELHEWVYAASDSPDAKFGLARRTWDSFVRDEVVASGTSQRRNTVSCSVPAIGNFHELEDTPMFCVCAVPLIVGERCIGAIELVNRRSEGAMQGRTYSRDDERLLALIADRVSEMVSRVLARRRAMEEERMSAIGSMLSGVVHDLKTPLAIAGGYVQMMARSNDPAQRVEFGRRVRGQFQHIEQMTRELLAYARGENSLFIRPIQLNNFVPEVTELLEHELAPNGIELNVASEWRGEALFDEGKVKRILYNLARNAREAMPGGGRLDVTFRRDGSDLVIEVADNGPGIPEALRERIFNAFVSTRGGGNSGLGLAIVRRFVDDHEGSIELDEAPGGGARFSIRLPIDGPSRTELGNGFESAQHASGQTAN